MSKSDFEAIEAFRYDPYSAEALDIDQVPSAVTLRQRLDTHAAAFMAPIIEASIAFLQRIAAPITPLTNSLVTLDADVALIIIPPTLFNLGIAAPFHNKVLRAQTHMGRPALGGFVIKACGCHPVEQRQDQERERIAHRQG